MAKPRTATAASQLEDDWACDGGPFAGGRVFWPTTGSVGERDVKTCREWFRAGDCVVIFDVAGSDLRHAVDDADPRRGAASPDR